MVMSAKKCILIFDVNIYCEWVNVGNVRLYCPERHVVTIAVYSTRWCDHKGMARPA